jgi:hypothetical protein
MKRVVLMLICVAFLAGCATTQMLQPEKPPTLAAAPDSALLVIVRDAWVGSAIVFWNYLDGKLIGETKGKTYIVAKVAPGPHYVVGATENTGVAHFDFQAGKRYFLRQGIAMGLWRARTSGYTPMTSQEAQEAIKNCAYLELDPKAEAPNMDPALHQKAIDEYNAGVKENPDGYKELLQYKGE